MKKLFLIKWFRRRNTFLRKLFKKVMITAIGLINEFIVNLWEQRKHKLYKLRLSLKKVRN